MQNGLQLIQKKNVIMIVCCAFILFFIGNMMVSPVSSQVSEQVLITVRPGMSAHDIGDLLYQNNLIKNVMLFRVIARIRHMESSLQAGEYSFSPNMDVRQMVAMLSKGETAHTLLVIPEGYTIEQIAKLIEDKQIGSAAVFKKIAQSASNSYMGDTSSVTYPTEGFLFPATYKIAKGTTEEQLFRQMTVQFEEKFTSQMRVQATNNGLSVKEVIILASLVEKEAQLPKDRPIIAGVFLNRLKTGMPLQSCATIQYILGYPKEELSVQDTEISSPYNTYQIRGLPPGPIANPGIESIKAVLAPAKTNYLYFVADKQGAHHFSVSYEEHLQKIKQVRE